MGTLLCLGSGAAFGAMAIFGKLAYDEGATVGTLLAVRFALAAALFWASCARRGARELRALPAPRHRRRPRARRVRLRAAGRLLLRRARAHRRLAALAAALHVPGDRRRRGDRCSAASASTARRADRARARLRRARARRRRAPERARSTRSAPRSASPPRSSTAPTSSSARASPGACAPHVLAALVCTGAAVALTVGSALLGELRPGELTAAGWGWLACLAVVSTVGAIGLFFAGLRARRPDRPRRSSPPSSRS